MLNEMKKYQTTNFLNSNDIVDITKWSIPSQSKTTWLSPVVGA
jgi:hypothetical protein